MATTGDIQAGLVIKSLEPVVESVFESSLAKSTWKTYRAAQADYLSFCQSINVTPIPASEDLLILYTAQLATRLTHLSIRTYLSAVRNLHIMQGVGDPMSGHLKFEQFMKGTKRLKSRPSDQRLPITPLILLRMRGVLENNPHNRDNIMLWAACCLGFFAFLRSGEFTMPSLGSFDPAVHLTAQDIHVAVDDVANPSMLYIHLKSSKCDQSRKGITLCVGRTSSQLCPVAAVLAYMAVRGFGPGPFLVFQDSSNWASQVNPHHSWFGLFQVLRSLF